MANTNDIVPQCQPCPPSCASVFDRVLVTYTIRSGALVQWELLPTFTDPLPYEFQLQVGRTPSNDSDDWEDVGLSVENVFCAVDGEQRAFGKTNWTHYRVKLTTPLASYLSTPTLAMGTLNKRDWLIARETVRNRTLMFRLGEGQQGFILKRRVTGQKCTNCLDWQTEETRQGTDCPRCFGTGYECGYFFPIGCAWARISPRAYRVHLDGGQGRGTVDDQVAKATMLATYILTEDDVWVNAKTDDRYFVHEVQHTAEWRGVPLLADVSLRQIAYTSAIYTVPVPDQLQQLTC